MIETEVAYQHRVCGGRVHIEDHGPWPHGFVLVCECGHRLESGREELEAVDLLLQPAAHG